MAVLAETGRRVILLPAPGRARHWPVGEGQAYILQESRPGYAGRQSGPGPSGRRPRIRSVPADAGLSGVKSVRVLTNNPGKLDALAPWVSVVGRVPFWGEGGDG